MTSREAAEERAAPVLDPPAMPYRVTDRVRWSDVDAAGILCYGSFLRFFELAETELFRALGLPIAMVPERWGVWLVRRRVECDFYRPLRLDEEVEVFAAVTALGRTSIELTFLARLMEEDRLAAESRFVAVAVDRDSFEPTPLDAELREALGRGRMELGEMREAIGVRPAHG